VYVTHGSIHWSYTRSLKEAARVLRYRGTSESIKEY
jgi:hypothetical protein